MTSTKSPDSIAIAAFPSISILFVGITVLIVFMILLMVLLFVGVGAYRLIAARKELSAIDLSDGLDESEIQIIRNALLKKQTADKEAAVKAKVAEVVNGSERSLTNPNYEDVLLKRFRDHWLELHLKPVPNPTWFQDWLNRIPSIGCHCQSDFQDIVRRLRPDFTSKEAFFEWSVAAHNCVNAKLMRPERSIEQVRQVYRPRIDGLVAVTSLSLENLHQHQALNSWLAAGLSIVAVQQGGEIDQLRREYWQVKDFIAANPWESAYEKPTVPISDMLAVASRLETKILLINSDIEIEGSQQLLIDARDSTAVSVGHRLNYQDNKCRTTPEEWGLDVFVLAPEHVAGLDCDRYEIGRPMWDYWLPYALKYAGFRLESIPGDLFFHRAHTQLWSQVEWQLGADWFQAKYGKVEDWVQFRKSLLAVG